MDVSPDRSASATGAVVDDTLLCPDCGYDLRGIADSERCPECGLAIERNETATSRIPWTHRARIGRLRAYFRTLWLASAKTHLLAREVARPVDFHDAQRFRFMTSLIVAIIPAACAAVLIWTNSAGVLALTTNFDASNLIFGAGPPPPPTPGLVDAVFPWLSGISLWPVLPLAIIAFALAATGVPSYWFHPARLGVVWQNRAVALSHYACAPLVALVVPALCVVLMMSLEESNSSGLINNRLFFALLLIVYAMTPAILIVYCVNVFRLLRRATRSEAGWLAWAVVGVVLGWVACAGVAFFVLPWIVGLIGIVVGSF